MTPNRSTDERRAARAVAAFLLSALAGCGGAALPAPEEAREPEPRACTAALRVQPPPGASDDDEVPRNVLSLALVCEGEPRRTLALGEEPGVCTFEGSSALRASCWWRDGVSTWLVEQHGARLVVLRALGEASTGMPEERGSLELPAGARLEPL